MKYMGSKKKIIKYINDNQPELYWDYRDELSIEQIDTILSSKDGLTEIEDEIFENSIDYVFQLEDELIKKVIKEFNIKFKTEEKEEEFKDFCRDYIRTDVNINELIDREKVILFYETDYNVGETWSLNDKEERDELRLIKKALKIPQKDKDYDKDLLMMFRQASYGGTLVIYFYTTLSEIVPEIDKNTLCFKDMHVAIINTYNGSGDNCFLKRDKYVKFPSNRDKISYENTIHYNYSFDVCGMVKDWCKGTQFYFCNKTHNNIKQEPSEQKKLKEINRKYQETYDKGGCTFGDIDINRHRDTYYLNEYPCGTHCPHCHQFWID